MSRVDIDFAVCDAITAWASQHRHYQRKVRPSTKWTLEEVVALNIDCMWRVLE